MCFYCNLGLLLTFYMYICRILLIQLLGCHIEINACLGSWDVVYRPFHIRVSLCRRLPHDIPIDLSATCCWQACVEVTRTFWACLKLFRRYGDVMRKLRGLGPSVVSHHVVVMWMKTTRHQHGMYIVNHKKCDMWYKNYKNRLRLTKVIVEDKMWRFLWFTV